MRVNLIKLSGRSVLNTESFDTNKQKDHSLYIKSLLVILTLSMFFYHLFIIEDKDIYVYWKQRRSTLNCVLTVV